MIWIYNRNLDALSDLVGNVLQFHTSPPPKVGRPFSLSLRASLSVFISPAISRIRPSLWSISFFAVLTRADIPLLSTP